MLLLEQFKELTTRPSNAKELKGMVLQLAAQGKLSAQWRRENSEVEQVADLVKRIKREKKLQTERLGSRIKDGSTPVMVDEIPFLIPNSWFWVRVGELGVTQTGSTPPKKDPANFGDFIPFIGPGDISTEGISINGNGLSQQGLSRSRLIPKDSVMMVCIGGSIGKHQVNKQDVCCNQQINCITPAVVPVKLLYYFMGSPMFQNSVLSKSTGSATPIINKGKWENIPFPLPPIDEQEFLAETIDKLFHNIDQLERSTQHRIQLKHNYATSALHRLTNGNTSQEWENLQPHFKPFFDEPENIQKLRETILQLAVQGKLTTKWRQTHPELLTGDNSASSLLEKIKKEKAALVKAGKIRKEKQLPPITEEEVPYELPKGWVWCRFAEATINRDGERIPVSKEERKHRDGIYDYYGASGVIDKIDDYLFDKDLLLIGEDGANLINRSTPIAFIAKGKYWVNNHAHVIDAFDNVTLEYYEIFINSINLEQYITGMAQPKMPQKRMNIIPIALPPIPEQKAIVAQVNGLMSLCDELEQQVQESQAVSEQLMQAVVREVVAQPRI